MTGCRFRGGGFCSRPVMAGESLCETHYAMMRSERKALLLALAAIGLVALGLVAQVVALVIRAVSS